MKLVPNVNSNIYTISAFVIGYFLLDDATPAEQNSLGNWFMLIGQVLCTNSAQQQVINNRNNDSNNSDNHIINDGVNNDVNSQIEMINRVIKAMEKEINELKKTSI